MNPGNARIPARLLLSLLPRNKNPSFLLSHAREALFSITTGIAANGDGYFQVKAMN